MKKLKLALVMAGLVGATSFQLQAQEFSLESYTSLSKVQQQENFKEVIVTLEEGYTLSHVLSFNEIEFKKIYSFSDISSVIVVNNSYNIENLISSLEGVREATLNKILKRKNITDTVYSMENEAANVKVQNNPVYNDPFLARQEYFKDSEVFPHASSIERLIVNKQEQNVRMRIGVIDTGTATNGDFQFSEAINLVAGEESRAEGAQDLTFDGANTCASGHGLQMSYTIGAISNNNIAGSGIVNADIVMVRAADTNCVTGEDEFRVSDVTRAIEWLSGRSDEVVETVISSSVDIINLSLGDVEDCTIPLQNAINNAVDNGIVIVAASGNDNVNASTFSPTSCENVIVVGSHDLTLNKASFSNFGDIVDVTTVGVDIISTSLDNADQIDGQGGFTGGNQGTSFSSAITSGVVGLIKEKYPSLNHSQAEILIKGGAVENSICTQADGCGVGILNAYNSMVMADQFFGFEFSPNHYYAERNTCEDTIYLSRMNQLVPVCDLYNIEITHPESFVAVDYQIVKRDSFENRWTEENTTVVASVTADEGVRSVTHLLKEYDTGSTYAIRSCTVDGECLDYKELDLSAVTRPAFCIQD